MISKIGEFRGEKNIFKTCKVLAIPTRHLLEHCCFLVAESCSTLCRLMDCSTPGFPVLHYLPEFAQTHVRWVSDAIQLSHPLSPPSPLALNLSQHQGLFQWVGSLDQVAKLLELQLQHQSFQCTFRVDYWKNHSLTIRTFISKVMSLLFNTLSTFVIAFLPRSNLLISWLQSPSTVILEPKKKKSVTVSTQNLAQLLI